MWHQYRIDLRGLSKSHFFFLSGVRYDAYCLPPPADFDPPKSTRMNGQLSLHPLAELIREISAKEIAGRLSLQNDSSRVVIYFKNGLVVYAASNIRTLRLP